MPTFDTPRPISVTIELVVGDVRIIASDRSDTMVEVRPRDESEASDVKAAAQTLVDYGDGTLLVRAPKQWRQYAPSRRGGSVDITIELPTGSRLDGDSSLGDVHCEGELGACRVKSAMGNFRLDTVGTLQLKTSSGTITVERALGDVDVTTGSGDIRIREIRGAATIRNSNGDTWVGDITGDLRVRGANGDIAVDRAHRSVSVKTAKGDVRIDDVVHGEIVLETAVGQLDVGIRGGIAAWLDVSSGYGNVRNALQAADGPGQSEGTVEVRARTSYGDILIRRSSAATTLGTR